MVDTWPILLSAAFLAGALNAVAGGGSFLTMPALIHVGVPPVAANATGTLALLPGYAGACLAHWRDLSTSRVLSLLSILVCLAGGIAGAACLMATSNQLFLRIVPWLLLAATLLFAFGAPERRLRAAVGGKGGMLLGLFVVSAYGGYFNGGLGIMLLTQLSLCGIGDLRIANGLKNFYSAVLTTVAAAVYAAWGAIYWPLAAGMAAAAMCGGYVGGRFGLALPPKLLHRVIVLIGLAMTVAFFMR